MTDFLSTEVLPYDAYCALFSVVKDKAKVGGEVVDVWMIREKPHVPGRTIEITVIGEANIEWQLSRLHKGTILRAEWLREMVKPRPKAKPKFHVEFCSEELFGPEYWGWWAVEKNGRGLGPFDSKEEAQQECDDRRVAE